MADNSVSKKIRLNLNENPKLLIDTDRVVMKNVHKINNLVIGLLNIRSITSKYDKIYNLIHDGLDLFVLTETWHGTSDDISIKLAMPPDYCFVDFLRERDPYHGGIIVFFKPSFRHIKLELPTLKTFEAICVRLTINKINFILLAIYRPGSALVTPLFFQELGSVLDHVTTICDRILIAGDFNIHIERPHDPHTLSLLELFASYQLCNVVNEPTHVRGGILDLLATSSNFTIDGCKIYPSGVFSDHSFICASLPIHREPCVQFTRYIRSWNQINYNNFSSLVNESHISGTCQFDDIDEAFDFFNNEMTRILDNVAPIHLVKSRYVPSAPWFDGECRKCKRFCRRKERLYKRQACGVNKDAWVDALNMKNKLFSDKRNIYWSNIIKINKNNPKKIWPVLNKILCKDTKISLDNTNHTAAKFACFFREKIDKVQHLTVGAGEPSFSFFGFDHDERFLSFSECSEVDVRSFIMNSPTKSCGLDSLPTHLFKKYIDLFLPYITSLINMCLSSGRFPACCKHAIVVPLLKKSSLEINDINNFRPVSNLSFLSKIIERIVAKQLLTFLLGKNLMPRNQSGYRSHHSTETALLQVCSDLFAASDAKTASILSLLDMSAAFDCVNHATLLHRLSISYGISGMAGLWFQSYINGRSQQISCKGILSDKEFIFSGVPQGSVLGPVLFLLYTADIFKIIQTFGFKGYAYADDIQIVASCPPAQFDALTGRLAACLSSVDAWMAQNGLKMNQCKTQVLPIGTWQQTSQISLNSIRINNTDLYFCSSATNLGFIFDKNMSMHAHIRHLVHSCTSQLRMLRLVKKSLTRGTLTSLVHSFVHSRLDYCNSLFYGVSNNEIALLQSVQNRAAKLISGGLRYDHVSPVLKELHWLPVSKRIIFKICVLMFKSLKGLAPEYLVEKCKRKNAMSLPYNLRSNDLDFLVVPVTRLKIGSRDFAVSGPAVWNGLPYFLRNPDLSLLRFKADLKTYLFNL